MNPEHRCGEGRVAALGAAVLAAGWLAGAAGARADVVALFDNPNYVNVGGGWQASADALQLALTAQGHTVLTFEGITAEAFQAAIGPANLVMFPELKNYGALVSDLSPEARALLGDYVAAGGGVVEVAGSYVLGSVLPGTGFASTGSSGPSVLDAAAAAGTPFANGPAVLDVPAAGSLNPWGTTLGDGYTILDSPNARNVYRDQVDGSPNGTTVLVARYRQGHVGYLAWNFESASPQPAGRAAWETVLGTTVRAVSGPPAVIPEPATVLLLLAGVPAVAVLGRARTRSERRQPRLP